METTIGLRGGAVAALAAGSTDHPAIVLAHGWPLCKEIWAPVLDVLARRHFVLAVDLPGVGGSIFADPPVAPGAVADLVLAAAEQAGARDVTFGGVDIGGMIAFAAARDHGGRVARAVMMNTVVPGVDPWSETLADPRIWHFAFHQTPDLPETLVRGRERPYFDFFVDALAGDKAAISAELRERFAAAYGRPEALKTGFDWYRALPAEAERNARPGRIATPILYLRGDADRRPLDPYLAGLRKAGVEHLSGAFLAGSGELLSVEQPERFAAALLDFVGADRGRARPK